LPALRIGVSQTLPFHDARLFALWAHYLTRRLQRPVLTVRRQGHTAVLDLLLQRRLDFAWVCPAHFLRHIGTTAPVAVPQIQGGQRFQLLVLAPARELPRIKDLADLKDKVIAFAEPDTNLGSAVVKRALRDQGLDPETFFRRIFYTGDHARVIRAVAAGVAHAGAVMDQAWAVAQQEDPATAARLRVIWRSGWRPLPPLVAAPGTDPAAVAELRAVLTHMDEDPEGREILAGLHFERFAAPDPALYQNAEAGGTTAGQALEFCGE
jgi:phosphonate transport system substrate-binding protein